jgi:hypothetical protein
MTSQPMQMGSDFKGQGFGTTPFPDWLLDKLMPRLRDVEWRLICILVRQTLGWQASDGKPKQSDWLSHSQLRRRTGRSSSAISPAIDFLCRNRLVEIDDGQGNPLRKAFERRRHRGPLFFRLNMERLKHKQKRLRLKKRIQKSGITINTLTKEAVVRSRKENAKSRIQKSESIQREWQQVGDILKGKRSRISGAGDEVHGST